MSARKWIGIVVGLAAVFAVFWFGYDLIALVGGRGHDRSVLTVLLLGALVILVGIQAGAIAGWGRWAGDDTFPVHRWMWSIMIAAVLLILSVAAT